ncbi:hypothetical protein AB4Z52_17185 [Rhizobium sp. 2YAF20]|uniref:hypothetical protein n=1 Tax=Rhizobium sp. 2YAF20 TaxID=3233027 RepID=UPI003F9EA5DE
MNTHSACFSQCPSFETRGYLDLRLIAIVFAIAFPMTVLTILVMILLTRPSFAS